VGECHASQLVEALPEGFGAKSGFYMALEEAMWKHGSRMG